jgi:hypothetical protein
LESARACIWLSQLAYEDAGAKQDRLMARWGLQKVALFDRRFPSVLPLVRTRGFVAAYNLMGKSVLLISFAGTDPLVAANWATDFAVIPTADGIHHGFATALQAVWQELSATVAAASPSAIVITGHSLGGALAILCGYQFCTELTQNVVAIYTFGQPRVSGIPFALNFDKHLGSATFRFVHGEDIVPTLPPSELGFRHVGRFISCGRGKKFELSEMISSSGQDRPSFSLAAVAGLEDGSSETVTDPPASSPNDLLGRMAQCLPPPIRDHLPEQYWKALAE